MNQIHWTTVILYNQQLYNLFLTSFDHYQRTHKTIHLFQTCHLLVSFGLVSLPEFPLSQLVELYQKQKQNEFSTSMADFLSKVGDVMKDFDRVMDQMKKETEEETGLTVECKSVDGNDGDDKSSAVCHISIQQLQVVNHLTKLLFGRLNIEMHLESVQAMNNSSNANSDQKILADTVIRIYKRKNAMELDHALELMKQVTASSSGDQSIKFHTLYHLLLMLGSNDGETKSKKKKKLSEQESLHYSKVDQEKLVNVSIGGQSFWIPDLSEWLDGAAYYTACISVLKHLFARRDNDGKSPSLAREYVALRSAIVDAPSIGFFHWLLARNYREQKQYSTSARTYKMAADLLPQGHFLLNTCYFRAALNETVDWNNDPFYLRLQIEVQQSNDSELDEELSDRISNLMKPVKELYQKGEQSEEENKYLVKKYLDHLSDSSMFLCSPDGSKALVKEKIELRKKSGTAVDLSRLSTPLCRNCQKQQSGTVPLKRCTACKHVFYCSVNCQRDDWPRHKAECAQLRK